MREVAEAREATNSACNWSIVAYPNEGWAKTVFGEPDVERLWDAVASARGSTSPTRSPPWRAHIAKLGARGALLNERRFDALRFRGPGTDLTVGLHPGARVARGARRHRRRPRARGEHADGGGLHRPRRRRVEGTVRATYPLAIQGTIVRDLEVRFEGGRAVEITRARART